MYYCNYYLQRVSDRRGLRWMMYFVLFWHHGALQIMCGSDTAIGNPIPTHYVPLSLTVILWRHHQQIFDLWKDIIFQYINWVSLCMSINNISHFVSWRRFQSGRKTVRQIHAQEGRRMAPEGVITYVHGSADKRSSGYTIRTRRFENIENYI